MRQAGRYLPEYREVRSHVKSFIDLCLSPALATKVTLQPIKRFDFDAAILFSDILMVPFGLGQELTFEEAGGPKLGKLQHLSFNHFNERLQGVFETVSEIRSRLDPSKSLIGFAGGVWTVLCYMIASHTKDWASVVLWAERNKDQFDSLMELVTDATMLYLDKQVEHGADIIQIFDSWSSVVPELYQDPWIIRPMEKIVVFLKEKYPNLKIIGFPKGFQKLEKYIQSTHVDGIGVDHFQNLDMDYSCLVQGNLSPETLVEGGDRLRREVTHILEKMSGKRFIFNLGHGILPHTPIKHVEKLIEIIKG